jgi:hypothetical protein
MDPSVQIAGWAQGRITSPSACQLHATPTAATIPATVLGHVPVFLRRAGRVWGSGLARGSSVARGEGQDDDVGSEATAPVHLSFLPNHPK